MTNNATDPAPYCAPLSRELGEPLVGTATRVDTWLLLEYKDSWRAQATTDNRLPPAVQEWLAAQLKAIPNSRLQFIRRAGRSTPELTFFVVQALTGRMHHLSLLNHRDLLQLDLPALLAGGPAVPARPLQHPLILICTNGKRDPCCALYGAALYRQLRHFAGDITWQTTHLGGHRFAPTVLTLPDSALYGRLEPDEGRAFVADVYDGRLTLPHLRGRTIYDPAVQAAEILLRRQTGETRADAYRFHNATQPAGDEWQVEFMAQETGRVLPIHLRRRILDLPLYASCGELQTKPVYHYELV